MSRLLSYLAVVAVLAMHHPVAAGPNANVGLSLDLIANAGAGNQRNDGVTSGTVSGRGTPIAIEVFATGVTTPLVGMQLRFDFNATLLTFVKAEYSVFPFNVPQPTGTDFAATSPVRLPSAGFLARAEFTTATEVTGREFSIGIASVILSESVASRDTLKTTTRIEFNSTGPSTPDFDGDGTVGFSDFLAFAGKYGAQRGDGRYQAKYDLNSDGKIDFSDFLIFASSYGNTIPTDGGGSEIVEIPDATLRAVISDSLNKAHGAPITRADMATLTSLWAVDKNINNLRGLEFAINLTELYLVQNHIRSSDLSALSGLTNLTELDISYNRISDIAALAGLTKLERLSLDGNQISDITALITALSGLTNLTWLDIRNNPLSATSINTHVPALETRGVTVHWSVFIPDANLRAVIENRLNKARDAPITRADMATLTSLPQLRNIIDLTGLEFATNLTTLNLNKNRIRISDITALAGLTNLRFLHLNSNRISDITALAGLTNLRELDLENNQISDIVALAKLTNLTDLRLSNNQITDIAPLSGLTNLTYLPLGYNQISDITALAGLTKLTWLNLSGNQISDITALAGLTKLTWLNLENNPLSATSINTHIPALETRGISVSFYLEIPDANLRAVISDSLRKARGEPITPADMASLRRISAGSKNINNLTGLEFATNLTYLSLYLSLDSNQISDITALAGLTKLDTLWLDGDQISDITALSTLTNLDFLYLGYNQISDITALATLTNLTELWLDGNQISDIAALSTLTNLDFLHLGYNQISDIAALSGLTNLDILFLSNNQISDISVLSTLTNLDFLYLGYNQISDIAALSTLTNLTELWLNNNQISDIAALSTLTNLEYLDLSNNPLSATSINTHIPALRARGVEVTFP